MQEEKGASNALTLFGVAKVPTDNQVRRLLDPAGPELLHGAFRGLLELLEGSGALERYRVLEWPLEPGDAVLFDFRALHGARGNPTAQRRRALSLRFVGDDVTYGARPGRTSPPYPGHGMVPGQRLREDWFPVVWRADA